METSIAGAWNPGLQSDIPQHLRPLITLFRQENAEVSHNEAAELSDLTGIPILDLVSLRASRLVIHALLVRVTANLTVADGPNYEELGINLRGMVHSIYQNHMIHALPAIENALNAERAKASDIVLARLSEFRTDKVAGQAKPEAPKSFWGRWFGRSSKTATNNQSAEEFELSVLKSWRLELGSASSDLENACLSKLIKAVDAIIGHRGRMLADHELVARIVATQVINTHGCSLVNSKIDDEWAAAVLAEGYRSLPVQEKPLVMNVKGASASGKSTIRPQQRRLAQKLGIAWEDFALISPDYWRKYLLSYETLDQDHKYGAMLTGQELEIIDKKLDAYMAEKAVNGAMPHLLIDRFRFDSFALNVDRTVDSTLLSRFGDTVYLFFMITHPANTVVRAWSRGKKTGRFKAVDDLLYHNVEAFTGMPSLFLSWVTARNKRIHFEFLDNDVPEGELPRTVGFGRNNLLVVLDIKFVLDIDRYRKVNVAARRPKEIFDSSDLRVEENTQFIVRCSNTVQRIVFADQDTMEDYLVFCDGELAWWDHEYIQAHESVVGLLETLQALGYPQTPCTHTKDSRFLPLDANTEKNMLVGDWSLR